MPTPQGIDSYITLGLESAYGTVATVGKKIPVVSESLRMTQPRIPNKSLGGDRNQRKPVLGRKDAGGSFRMYAGIDSIPLLLKGLTGGLTTTGASDPFTHTSKTTTVRPPSFTVETFFEMGATDQFKRLLGAEIDQFQFDVTDEGFLELGITWCGREVTYATSSFHAGATDWTAEEPFEHLQLAAADVKLNGTAIARIGKVSITVNNNIKKDVRVLGGLGKRKDAPFGRQEVNGTVDLYFEGTEERDLAVAAAAVDLDLKWTQPTANRTLQILIPEVYLEVSDAAAESDDPLMLSLPFIGSKDATEASQFKGVVVNGNNAATYA